MTKTSNDAKKSASDISKKISTKAHLAFLLDESGSMSLNQESVVTGVNEFLATFRKNKEADVRVWLAMFDAHPGEDRTRIKIKGKKVSGVKNLKIADYTPRGMTPLNDAILDTIEAMDKAVEDGERVFVVILTDGLENASEASAETVKKAIRKRERGKDGWGFLYLGANQVAERVSAGIGLGKQGQSFNFTSTPTGTSSAMSAAVVSTDSFLRSPTKAEYDVQAAALYKKTGGVIPEDEEEAKKKISTPS